MKIKTVGTPCLHMESRPLMTVNNKVLKFIAKMVNAMAKANGIGIAAPQVGKNIQVCAVVDHEKQTILVMVNPKIVLWSVEKETMEEGCLSCPGETRNIERSKYIDVDYISLDGKLAKMRCTDLLARIVQHEIDHLEGTVITDYPKDKENGKEA